MTKVRDKNSVNSLAVRIGIALVAGIVFGLICMAIRESLNSSGNGGTWNMINKILFQDITAAGAESAIGIFYIIGQLFIKALQLIIVPMVFTSIALAIGQISDTKTLGRISAKTIGWFLLCSFFALLLACIVGYMAYSAGLFHANIEGLEGKDGTGGTNPLLVILNIVPNNITAVFGNNGAVLAILFLAIVAGLSMTHLGEDKTKNVKALLVEVNEIVMVFLNFVVTHFAPIAIFCLLARTFASYGINYLKPAVVYMILTTILLLIYLFIGYPLLVAIGCKLSPMIFIKKIIKVIIFGFSTSSSAATLPLNMQTNTEEFGVDNQVASFVLPLGMTINMNGTAIMQVIATLFIAGSAGYEVSFLTLVIVAILALIASAGTPAAPGAGAIILFTILSGVGYTNEIALVTYALILAINRPIEMLVTTLNVVGDSTACLYVAKSENLLNEEVYNNVEQ